MENENTNLFNYEFFKWLEKYTEKKRFFSVEDALIENNPETKKNISSLPKFYDFIREYAKINNIDSKINSYNYGDGSHFSIKFNNVMYNVGFQHDTFDNLDFFCERVPIDIIDFTDDFQEPSKKH